MQGVASTWVPHVQAMKRKFVKRALQNFRVSLKFKSKVADIWWRISELQ